MIIGRVWSPHPPPGNIVFECIDTDRLERDRVLMQPPGLQAFRASAMETEMTPPRFLQVPCLSSCAMNLPLLTLRGWQMRFFHMDWDDGFVAYLNGTQIAQFGFRENT